MQVRLRRRFPKLAPFIFPIVAIVLVLQTAPIPEVFENPSELLNMFNAVLSALISVPLLAMLTFVVVTVLIATCIMSLNTMIIKPTAFMLQRTRNDKPIKAVSLLMILIGFQFDLLVS